MRLSEADRNYLEQLHTDNHAGLLQYAGFLLKHSTLAEEAVQDTFVVACRYIEALKNSPNPVGWLYKTLRLVCLRIEKIQNADLYYLSELSDFLQEILADPVAEADDPTMLYSGMIGQEDYALLQRFAIEGYSVLELSKELGISAQACRKRLERARKAFRRQYAKTVSQK